MEIYATESEADYGALRDECFQLGLSVFSGEPYNKLVMNNTLVPTYDDGNVVPNGTPTKEWQKKIFDKGINMFYMSSATEFNFSEPRQLALKAIAESYPSVSIIPDFEPYIEPE